MAVLSLQHFGILLIAQVALGIPWSDRPAARYEGYDLERGPVLYEAYYPEEPNVEIRDPSPNIYQEKRYFDRINVPERSYQISADPYEIPYEPEMTDIREEYRRPNSGYLSAFTGSRPQTVQKKDYIGHDQRHKDYVFGEQPLNERTSQDHLKSAIVNDYTFVGPRSNAYDDQDREESDFVEQNQMNFGEDVQRIVPIDEEFIFGEPPVEKVVPDFQESFRDLNQKEVFDTQNFGADYNRQKEVRPVPMENIFEPRPQTINYVFSAPKKVDGLKSVKFESESEDNEWPRNYGDNLIRAEVKKADEQELKDQEAKIASIEVSQVPHHKIRHHHGERPKRKYINH